MNDRNTGYERAKRWIDVCGALLGLLAVSPLTPFIWLAIRLESTGPALIRLERISAGRIVRVYKFRTMISGAHHMRVGLRSLNERADGPFFKIRNDPRITRVGKILRKFRLDEFPQLINVLWGELALVGPRPHEPEEAAHYPEEYKVILRAKAGVTGLSQVSGASSLSFRRELELDHYYIHAQSLGLDAKILWRTARIIFTDPTAV
jgi:lipopolysaccharide/colanic/teichoic acid biosynthesis glycosyltransferase